MSYKVAMLGSHKKRHRRKKKNEAQQLLLTIKPVLPPQVLQSKAKLKQSYVLEELEVKQSLSARLQNDEPSLDGIQQQQEISFFTDTIIVADCDRSASSSLADGEEPVAGARLHRDTSISSPGAKTTDDGPQLTSSYIQLDDDAVIEKWIKAKVHFNQTYSPNFTTIIAEDESPSTEPVRNLDDEGLFVWPKPLLSSKRNEILTINRCLASSPPVWTQCNQNTIELVGLRNFTVSRELVKSVASKVFVSHHYAPIPVTKALATDALPTAAENILNIHIGDMCIASQSSERKEQNIAGQIDVLYQQYLDRMENRAYTEHLKRKLEVVRQLLAQTQSDETIKRKRITEDRRDTRRALYRELQADRELLERILENWKSLKELRHQQGFNETALKLIIKAEPADEDSDRRLWDEKFILELNECLEEALDNYQAEKEDGHRVKRPNADEIEDDLHEMFVKALRHPGEPKLFLELHKTATGNNYKPHQEASSAKYRVQIKINGKIATSAKSSQALYATQDRVPLNATFAIHLPMELPKSIQLIVSTY